MILAVLAGPTASGKTALALRWAAARGARILSADSRQIYRGFAVGTGLPSPDELRAVPHHLVACVDPSEAFSPRRFRAEAEAVLDAHPDENFLVVGGTGLYLKEWMENNADRGEVPPDVRAAAAGELQDRGLSAVHAELTRLDPEGMRSVDPHDGYRIQKRLEHWRHFGRTYAVEPAAPNPRFANVPFLWLDPPREELHRAIEARVRDMAARGWLDEVRALLQTHDPDATPAFNAVGYREMADVAAGRLALKDAVEHITQRTRQYAKRQTTFFRHQIPHARAYAPEGLAMAMKGAGWDAGRLGG